MKGRTKVGLLIYIGIMSALLFSYQKSNSMPEAVAQPDSTTTKAVLDPIIQVAPVPKDSLAPAKPSRRHDTMSATSPTPLSATLRGPTTVSGNTLQISLDSKGADHCQMTSPSQSGVSPAFSMSFGQEHPWYPKIGEKTTFIVVCSKSGSTPVAANLTVERVSKSQ